MQQRNGPDPWAIWERLIRLEVHVEHLSQRRQEHLEWLQKRQDDMRRETLEHLGHLERRMTEQRPASSGLDFLGFIKKAPWRLMGWGIQLVAATGLGWYLPGWLKAVIAHF
jgi:hypothetical protein